MLEKPLLSEVTSGFESTYELIKAVSVRARQIAEEQIKEDEGEIHPHPLSEALEEIKQGKLTKIQEQEETVAEESQDIE